MGHHAHEHVEHAGHESDHDSGGHSSIARWIGITIAVEGVLLALCAAQLGAARTELISAMVQESSAKSEYTAVASKYRMLQAQLQHLHAAMPDPEFISRRDTEIKTIAATVKNPDALQSIRVSQLQTEKVMNTVVPTPDDVERFLAMLNKTREQTDAAKAWSESFPDAVNVHKAAAEHFELALVSVEIGIVIASVSLLLARQVRLARLVWIVAMLLGGTSMSIAGSTFFTARSKLHAAEEKIHVSEHKYTHMSHEDEEVAHDKKLEAEISKQLPALRRVMQGDESMSRK